MTSISSLYSGIFSQLNSSTSKTAQDTQLPDISTDSVDGTSSSGSSNDSVSLSAAAQAYLASIGQNVTGQGATNGNNNSANYSLTDSQKKQINDILAKYKDAPFTQDTYNKIQGDLQQAGLSPDQLQLQEQVKSFNSTQALLDALNNVDGDQNTINNLFAQPVDQNKSNNYMQSIVAAWQKVSTTYTPDEA